MTEEKTIEMYGMVKEMHGVLFKNGLMKRMSLVETKISDFFKNRESTCPVSKDLDTLIKHMDVNAKNHTRIEERRKCERREDRMHKLTILIAIGVMLIQAGGLWTKLVGWW